MAEICAVFGEAFIHVFCVAMYVAMYHWISAMWSAMKGD